MFRIGLGDAIGIAGIVLAIVLLVLDKAGKLKGPMLLVLLAVAAVMTLPLVLDNTWVGDAPSGMLKFSRAMLMFFVVGAAYSALAVWISGEPENLVSSEKGTPPGKQEPPRTNGTSAPVVTPPTLPTKRGAQVHSSVQLNAYLQGTPYPEGVAFAGIVWQREYSDVRLDISVKDAPIRGLDFVVSLDTTIMGIGQISQFPGVTAFPLEGNVQPLTLIGKDEKGQEVAIPISPTPGNPVGAPTYRVHCTELYANTVVHLALASRALNPPKPDGSLPDHLFAPARNPRVIEVKGTYESGGARHTIKFEQHLDQKQPETATEIPPGKTSNAAARAPKDRRPKAVSAGKTKT
jgi:hypothetical protein